MREFNVRGNGLDTLVRTITLRWRMEKWMFDSRIHNDEAVMRVYVCPWLEAIKKSGREHVIPVMCGEVCESVYRSWAEAINPDMTLERTRRMGSGDRFCEFRYTMKKQGERSSQSA